MRRQLIAGNWKMNTDRAGATALVQGIVDGASALGERAELVVCPPFPYLGLVADVLNGSDVALGAHAPPLPKPAAHRGHADLEALLDKLPVES